MWESKRQPKLKAKKGDKYDRVRHAMWIKCDACGRLVYYKDFKENHRVCPKCGVAAALTPAQRFNMLFDDREWDTIELPRPTDDPLKFTDRTAYEKRLEEARDETEQFDALVTADGEIGGVPATISVLDGDFMMGSVGRAVGDGIIASMEHAIEKNNPFIMIVASGGMRMQENLLSLMQMARATAAVNRLHEKKIPYIVVLTDPTFGGTTASFAMLGDVHIAEKGARIGFAGRRVIEQNMHEKLPSNFQTADFLYDHGFVDIVSRREELREYLEKILAVATKLPFTPDAISIPTPRILDTRRHKHSRRDAPNAAYEKVLLARNENRPHFLDYIAGLVDGWVPLAGDRLFGEDAAMQGGIGYLRGIPSVIIGQEKGRTIDTRTKYRFGMPNPEGYRKASRLMRLAEKWGLPVVSLVDTSGANASGAAEERGQSAAVATSIQTGLEIATPYVSVIVGEGGSGGAIAIATGDRVLMMENAIYSVISPESAASILWKDNKYKMDAALAMKLTAADAAKLNVIDRVIPEPAGGAHNDWQGAMELLGDELVKQLTELSAADATTLPAGRARKFLSMTRDVEIYGPEN
ncbi:MAG: acetyl-CoA carboxylase, carboxyltransferase subunit beta [Rickettsiales bacterium]|jgi:acetyl-CoA carboxylase carboxyl transferase subunit beta|nr:acetyl-CoA carboxylase, carboxyltransferase subunit beta [Rickettsiales bacterium]